MNWVGEKHWLRITNRLVEKCNFAFMDATRFIKQKNITTVTVDQSKYKFANNIYLYLIISLQVLFYNLTTFYMYCINVQTKLEK